jgi:hypothetical protein
MATESTEDRIREARLIVARPEDVWAALRDYGEEIKKGTLFGGDPELEKSLLMRTNPLIDLGLARYGGDSDVVAALYKKTHATSSDHLQQRYLHGLRVACLANESLRGLLPSFKNIVSGEELKRLVKEGDDEEMSALLSNPLSDDLLESLYENKQPFSAIDDERRRRLVMLSIYNPRLTDNQDDEHGPDMTHWGIHKGIVGMLATVPTTYGWLRTFRSLLDRLDPGAVRTPDAPITAILDRWINVPMPDGETKKEQEGYYTPLSLRDEFRCLVASLYGAYYDKTAGKYTSLNVGSSDSPDIALRCAHYGKVKLTVAAMKEGYARDGDVFVFAALCNSSVYYDSNLRRFFEEQVLSGDIRHVYKRRCEQIHKRQPSFDPRPASEWLIDDQQENEKPESNELRLLKQIEASLGQLAKKVLFTQTWVFWGLIILAALVFFKGR